MEIATWNCNGALRNKLDALEVLKFDIAFIQEREAPERSTSATYRTWAKNYLWAGNSKHKGLGAFAAPGAKRAPVDLDFSQLESFFRVGLTIASCL